MCRSEACSLPVAPVLPADMPFPRPRLQPMKPKLPRKLANSARINLNKYWHALEELMPVSRRTFDESDSNAINENIDNERRLAAMRLSETLGVGNPGPSNSPEAIVPSVSIPKFGKNTSFYLNMPSPSNTLPDAQTSALVSSPSPMNTDEPSTSKTHLFLFSSTESVPEDYPDENTPPLNGSIVGGNSQ